MDKNGQKNAVMSCKLPEEIILTSATSWITVLLFHKARKSSTAPQTESSQILWGHRLLPLESLHPFMLTNPTANGF